jgi:hypothetical protein
LDGFTRQLESWAAFYSTVSLASVTLAGLLFVSLSLHREARRGEDDTRLMRLARGSFGDFLYILMLGLVFLVPHPAPVGLAVALFALGAARGIGLIRWFLRGAGTGKRGARWDNAREIALPAIASLGFIAVAVEILRGEMVAVYALVIVVAALLATASWNAWLILAEEGPGVGPS